MALRFGERPKQQPTGYRAFALGGFFVLAIVVIAALSQGTEAFNPATSATAPAASTTTSDNPAGVTDGEQLTTSLELAMLDGVQDFVRSLDSRGYFYLMNLARQNPPAALEASGRSDVTFSQLFNAPAEYRGQLITLEGRARRITRNTCKPNRYGLETFYEAWVYTLDGGKNPSAVVFSDPPDCPIGGNINEPITVTGFFLGWWRYDSQEGKPHTAPLLIGRRILWQGEPPSDPATDRFARWIAANAWMLALLIAIAFFAGVAGYYLFQSSRRLPSRDQELDNLKFE